MEVVTMSKSMTYKFPVRSRGFISAVEQIKTKSGVLSVHFKVGDHIWKTEGKKAIALLTWHSDAYVEVEGWKTREDAPEAYANHGQVLDHPFFYLPACKLRPRI
jgi:hypothetical protein